MTLEIPNWDARFETAQSRKAGAITWTPLRHSFAATLKMQPRDVAAVMMQLVILAATMPNRGKFNDGGRDLTVDEIATYVGADAELVGRAMSALGVGSQTAGSVLPARSRQKEGRKEGAEGGNSLPRRKRESRGKATKASSDALAVAHHLRDAILSHTPDHACRLNGRADKWAKDIDLALREDKRTVEGLKRAIDFAHKRDAETFWRPNIQSGKKLRAQYDTMLAQAKRDLPPPAPKPGSLLERLGISTEGFTE